MERKSVQISIEVYNELMERPGRSMTDKIANLLENDFPQWIKDDAQALADFDGISLEDAIYKITHFNAQPTRVTSEKYFDGFIKTDQYYQFGGDGANDASVEEIRPGFWGVYDYGRPVILLHIPTGADNA